MKATEQYFPVVLFIMLYKVFLTVEFVHKMLKCDHSNESSCNDQYYHQSLFVSQKVTEVKIYHKGFLHFL